MQRQSGVILIGGMFFLLVMTLIGVALVKNITLEEKIAGNTREKLRSFQAAELSLDVAGRYLARRPDVAAFYDSSGATIPGIYKENASASSQPWMDHAAWSADHSLGIADTQHLPEQVRVGADELARLHLSNEPKFMIGLVGEQGLDGMDSSIAQHFFVFRVTSRASGKLQQIGTTLQSRVIQAL
ncbi:MAG TPA: hypothetical protein ENK26_06195 [Gammaproteobacteria bacterium]|nr:hypothetical protein [Gammaproteobacteria bacterium]